MGGEAGFLLERLDKVALRREGKVVSIETV